MPPILRDRSGLGCWYSWRGVHATGTLNTSSSWIPPTSLDTSRSNSSQRECSVYKGNDLFLIWSLVSNMSTLQFYCLIFFSFYNMYFVALFENIRLLISVSAFSGLCWDKITHGLGIRFKSPCLRTRGYLSWVTHWSVMGACYGSPSSTSFHQVRKTFLKNFGIYIWYSWNTKITLAALPFNKLILILKMKIYFLHCPCYLDPLNSGTVLCLYCSLLQYYVYAAYGYSILAFFVYFEMIF